MLRGSSFGVPGPILRPGIHPPTQKKGHTSSGELLIEPCLWRGVERLEVVVGSMTHALSGKVDMLLMQQQITVTRAKAVEDDLEEETFFLQARRGAGLITLQSLKCSRVLVDDTNPACSKLWESCYLSTSGHCRIDILSIPTPETP